MEDVGIVYRHLVYFVAIRYILWRFGIFYGYLVYFSPFLYVAPEKYGNPANESDRQPRNVPSEYAKNFDGNNTFSCRYVGIATSVALRLECWGARSGLPDGIFAYQKIPNYCSTWKAWE
jgi:hypothetical protein